MGLTFVIAVPQVSKLQWMEQVLRQEILQYLIMILTVASSGLGYQVYYRLPGLRMSISVSTSS